ncbi:hypothetical protein P3G55_03615 [Leptospira sp. 96542]|nr:hypothetical protein [Leptospira sp. 96542]
MLKNFVRLVIEYRLYFAIYLSVVFHLAFVIFSFNAKESPYFTVFCGPPWIYITEEEKEVQFSMNFGKFGETGDESSGEPEDGEEGEEGGKSGFEKGKYAGGKWDDLVKDLESTSSLRKKFRNDFDQVLPSTGVSDSYIRRPRDYEDIIVKDVFPTISGIRDPFKVDIKEAENNLFQHKERNRIIEEFRKGEESSPPITMRVFTDDVARPKSPLTMPKDDRQRYLDKTLKQKKEKQLDEFISRFSGYDPNRGDLSLFVRDLYYENLQRLAHNFSADPSYFSIDYFQENLNKEDFLRQMMALLSENLGTKAGTEILFTIENIYLIQSTALKIYFQNKSLLQNLTPEQKQTLRMETLRRVNEKYKPLLRDKKLLSLADVEGAYNKKQLDIIDTLIQNTPNGYRLKDAYFERGRILWESGIARDDESLLFEAIKNWEKIPSLKQEGDFLAERSFEAIDLALRDFGIISKNAEIPPVLKNQLDMIVKYRLADDLRKKQEREDRLLWPKKKSKF